MDWRLKYGDLLQKEERANWNKHKPKSLGDVSFTSSFFSLGGERENSSYLQGCYETWEISKQKPFYLHQTLKVRRKNRKLKYWTWGINNIISTRISRCQLWFMISSIQASHWSAPIMWPQYRPLIGQTPSGKPPVKWWQQQKTKCILMCLAV